MNMIENFRVNGKQISCERYGNGHINETYRVVCTGGIYILQNINTKIFTNPVKLMENIASVCEFVRKKVSDPRSALTIIPANDGKSYYVDEENKYWRVYEFIQGSVCLEKAETPSAFYESAVGFGMFQRHLADFPAETLYETIKDFHNTPDRYRKFKESLSCDTMGRAKNCEREIEFILKREDDAKALTSLCASGVLPLRVTHNDTKLNNVLLDEKTKKALCVIDLDTVMPGLAAYDFGDSIRFGATSAPEDEKDVSKVHFVKSLYETYCEGYLYACGKALHKEEIETLPEGAKLMTLECGVRFLTDYLDGDTYFRTAYPDHNLVRSRTQFALVSGMESEWDFMKKTVTSY